LFLITSGAKYPGVPYFLKFYLDGRKANEDPTHRDESTKSARKKFETQTS